MMAEYLGNDQDNILRVLPEDAFENDVIRGFGGNDIINGRGGDDLLDGGEGIDTAEFTETAFGFTVNLQTGTANNNVAGVQDISTLIGIENVVGSKFRDIIIGNDVADWLEGGLGDDSISGGGGMTFSSPARVPTPWLAAMASIRWTVPARLPVCSSIW